MLPVLLACLLPAHALTSHQTGPSLDLGAGLGLRGAPLRPAVGGDLALGWWLGTFDDQFAFGRYWLLQGVGRVDWRPDALALTPMLELRRGVDILVAGLSWGLGGGAVLVFPTDTEAPPPGWTARASMAGRFRRTRALSLTLRLEAGADVVGGTPSFAGGTLLGASFLRPARNIEPPDPSH
jgi:hypothetical protein